MIFSQCEALQQMRSYLKGGCLWWEGMEQEGRKWWWWVIAELKDGEGGFDGREKWLWLWNTKVINKRKSWTGEGCWDDVVQKQTSSCLIFKIKNWASVGNIQRVSDFSRSDPCHTFTTIPLGYFLDFWNFTFSFIREHMKIEWCLWGNWDYGMETNMKAWTTESPKGALSFPNNPSILLPFLSMPPPLPFLIFSLVLLPPYPSLPLAFLICLSSLPVFFPPYVSYLTPSLSLFTSRPHLLLFSPAPVPLRRGSSGEEETPGAARHLTDG